MTRPSARMSLAAVLGSAAIPYGVTIVVSSEILLLRRYNGEPGLGTIFGFALGSVVGYACVAQASRSHRENTSQATAARRMRDTGSLHFVGVGGALLVSTALAHLDSWWAWPVTGAVGISTYLCLVALQYLFVSPISSSPPD